MPPLRGTNFFTEDEQKTGYAECANYVSRTELVKKREVQQETVTDKKGKIESKKLDLQELDIEVNIKRNKDILNPPPSAPTPSARTPTPEEDLAAFMNQAIGIEDAAEQYRAKVTETWKHDPDQLKKHLLLLEAWVSSKGMK